MEDCRHILSTKRSVNCVASLCCCFPPACTNILERVNWGDRNGWNRLINHAIKSAGKETIKQVSLPSRLVTRNFGSGWKRVRPPDRKVVFIRNSACSSSRSRLSYRLHQIFGSTPNQRPAVSAVVHCFCRRVADIGESRQLKWIRKKQPHETKYEIPAFFIAHTDPSDSRDSCAVCCAHPPRINPKAWS